MSMCACHQFRTAEGDGGPVVRGVVAAENETATVLVVDDDSEIATLTAAYLKRLEADVTVLVETAPADALALFEETGADCVVSDYEMPGMDGLDVVSAVRERDPSVPVVLFTATGDETVAERASGEGVPFVPKGSGGFERLAIQVATVLDED